MSVKIPPAGGVPGIPGPPDWLSTPPAGNWSLEDVRWLGAIKRMFGSGGAGSNSFRAAQAVEAGQQYLYLSFRAAFAPAMGGQFSLSDQFDSVYLGLRKQNETKAMVIRLQAHDASLTSAGPPSGIAPAHVASVQASTRLDTDTGSPWPGSANPAWIDTNSRAWLQKIGDVAGDPNNRWAVQVRVPVQTSGGIDNTSGPDLGTEFDMWYLITGTLIPGMGLPPALVILGEHRVTGTTTGGDIFSGNYPNPFVSPTPWDSFELGAPGTFGGVAIYGNGSTDVRVWNAAYGEGTKIENGSNTFIARPRNYRPPNIQGGVDLNEIAVGAISATFRMANWGSVGGDPDQVNWASGTWDYVPGNDALTPVPSNLAIPTLTAGSNPPANQPINLPTTLMRAGKSYHQCIYVTLSGANLQFLNDSTFQNMDYELASVVERDADINVRGVSPAPPEVYLAIEKINMPRDLPPDTDNGVILEARMKELMEAGALPDDMFKALRSGLAQSEQSTPRERLAALVEALSAEGLSQAEIDQLFPTFRVHAYHDTGERITNRDGKRVPVYREQSSFGLYAYHEGPITGWATSIVGAERTADNVYRVSVPPGGVAKIRVRIQAVTPGERRIPEDPIGPTGRPGCLAAIRKLIRKLIMKLLGK